METLKKIEKNAIMKIEKETIINMIIETLETLGFAEKENKSDNNNEFEFAVEYNDGNMDIFINTNYDTAKIKLDCYYNHTYSYCSIPLIYNDIGKINIETYIEILLENIFINNYKFKNS